MDERQIDALVTRTLRGDLEAFSMLVRELHGPLRGLAAMMAVRPEWTDDVLQEVFIELHKALGSFDPERSFLAWSRGVALNVIRRHARARARESKLRQDAVSELLRRQAERQLRGEPARRAAGRLAALGRCLEALPGHLRRMLDMRYGEERTAEEIAERTGRQADAIRMTLMRTRRQLQDCVRDRLAQEAAGA